jgi:cytochrome P450
MAQRPPLPPPSPRAHLMVRALLAELLEQKPAAALGRLIESLANDFDDRLEERIRVATWCHDGLASFVSDIASRLIGSPVTSCEYDACDADATVTLADMVTKDDLTPGSRMCEHHAAVSLLAGMLRRFVADAARRHALPGNDYRCPNCELSGYDVGHFIGMLEAEARCFDVDVITSLRGVLR